jgi:hypothetical protein
MKAIEKIKAKRERKRLEPEVRLLKPSQTLSNGNSNKVS